MKVSTLLEDFSSTKKSPLFSNGETVVAEHFDEIREEVSADHSRARTSTSQKESDYDPSPSESFSEHDEDRLSESELNYALGKQSRRVAWCKEEIELVKGTFKREIDLNLNISLAQVKEFYTKNIEAMRRRSPHLIIQWIKGEQKRKQRNIANMKPKKERYTIEEQAVLEETIANHMKEESLPSIAECSFLIEQNDVLSSRSPASIKSFIYNKIKKRRTI
ncbi:uncharacterized protein LOC123313574 [Coccinella septempunctata]|uniref:uncharacterized protein LOC123313574 n=1 Tax=Coccinella septempunctata TaxID=41139 RepID=UPI001D08085E|nr:uncharacterized protein LOC123313574 [Coccinella septempunctata]